MCERKSSSTERSPEEEDQLRPSTKKYKATDEGFEGGTSRAPKQEGWMEGVDEDVAAKTSFRDMLMRHNGEAQEGLESDMELIDSDDASPEPNGEPVGEEVHENGIRRVVDEAGYTDFLLTKQAKERMCTKWRQSIIVKLLGRRIGVVFMKKKLEMLWAKKGKVTVSDIRNDFFVVNFTEMEDLIFALTEGPWVILGHYLSIRRWEPNFDPDTASISTIAAWVRLPDVPMEYFDSPFLKAVGN